ncbi:hypothetical protein J2752_001560 [Halarchaeum rubridurum]|uniref:Uncharacterized protein n=1 Tax=Halarchaeum rubridurum TaxID=489911 RepID=A0A830FYQ3_9EURY|nr:hypothetical protein [Halarchaeum rubridurum]MBP1954648.1 hypothetical protein [Halarchaeum rubridurum]GGM62723.1 hypothetical protein GCM10009017_11080 [Halarchaeum rubridurum]
MSDDLSETAADLASDLVREDIVVLSRPDVNHRLKTRLDVSKIDHDLVTEAFADEGWEYSRHLYYHPQALRDATTDLADDLRGDGRLLVTHDEVCDELARESQEEEPVRDHVTGWKQGGFDELVRGALEESGWRHETVERRGHDLRVYLRPLYAVFEESYPSGKSPLTTDELFSHYLSTSMADALEDR